MKDDSKVKAGPSRKVPRNGGDEVFDPDHAPLERLVIWHMSYELHPPPFQKKLKEKDVIEAEKHAFGHQRTTRAMPNPYQLFHPGVKGETKHMLKRDWSHASDAYKTKLPPIVNAQATRRRPPSTCIYSEKFDARAPPVGVERQRLDHPPPQLKRRPLGPVEYLGLPIAYTKAHKPSSPKPFPDPKKHDDWRKFSLAAMARHDPLDPDSFYNQNFALMLKTIPRAHERKKQECRTVSRTPDMESEFFDGLPNGVIKTESMDSLDEHIAEEHALMHKQRIDSLVNKFCKYAVRQSKKHVFRDVRKATTVPLSASPRRSPNPSPTSKPQSPKSPDYHSMPLQME